MLAELRSQAQKIVSWYTCEQAPYGPWWELSQTLMQDPGWKEKRGSKSTYRLLELDGSARAGNVVAEKLLGEVRRLFEASSKEYTLSRVQLIDNNSSTKSFQVAIESLFLKRTGKTDQGPWDLAVKDDGEKPAWASRLTGAFLPSGISLQSAPRDSGGKTVGICPPA